MLIDAFGKQCPLPVMLAKQQIDAGTTTFQIQVDNQTAVKNLTHLAQTCSIPLKVDPIPGGHLVSFLGINPMTRSAPIPTPDNPPSPLDTSSASPTLQEATPAPPASPGVPLIPLVSPEAALTSLASLGATPVPQPSVDSRTLVFIPTDRIGTGDEALGRNLMNMALFTLSEMQDKPQTVVLMNAGVTLIANPEAQAVESLQKLVQSGTQVLVCGTCLDFYGISMDDKDLPVGEVSNMYSILEAMQAASKVITL